MIGKEKVYKGQYADDLVADRALAWLSEKRDKPFCLLLWFQTPHAPFFRARRHLDLYNGLRIAKPAIFDDDLKGYSGKPRVFADAENKIGATDTDDTARSLDELVKDYYVGLVTVDENIGRIFQYFEKFGKLEDTAILQTSDYGFFLGERRLFDKRLMHEPSIRVPLMFRYPRQIKLGVVRDEMILDIDIAPTLLDLANVNIPDHMQGTSVVGLIGIDNPSWRKEWFYDYYEYPCEKQVKHHRSIRTERYKLIHYYQKPQKFELYDLTNDPGETQNLYGDPQHLALQQDLWGRLQKLQNEIPTRQAHQAT